MKRVVLYSGIFMLLAGHSFAEGKKAAVPGNPDCKKAALEAFGANAAAKKAIQTELNRKNSVFNYSLVGKPEAIKLDATLEGAVDITNFLVLQRVKQTDGNEIDREYSVAATVRTQKPRVPDQLCTAVLVKPVRLTF